MVITIESVFNNNHNHYNYEAFFKKYMKMLSHNRIDVSEGIDVNKTSDN